MAEFTSNNLLFVNVKDGADGEAASTYYFQSDYQEIYKFYDINNNVVYAPTSFTITLYKRFGDSFGIFTESIIIATCRYLDGSGVQQEIVMPASQNGTITIDLSTIEGELVNILFVGKTSDESNIVAEATYQAIYGTSKDLAIFAKKVSTINAAMKDKLLFDESGLTVQHGGLTVKVDDSETKMIDFKVGDTSIGELQVVKNQKLLLTGTTDISVITLAASNWTSDTGTVPFKYRIENDFITADSLQEVIPDNNSITYSQLKELWAANIIGGEQGEGYCYIQAYGTKPTSDINVILIIKMV